MKARSALSIQRDVVFAIFVREMNSRFRSYTFGNVWLILEPLLMISIFIVVFGARGRGEFGYAEPPVFIFVGFLPFKLLWGATMRATSSAFGSASGMLGFRQVRLFDVFMARAIVEGGLFLVTGVLLGCLLWWLGFSPMPGDIMGVLVAGFVLWLMAGFFGILVCMVSQLVREVGKVVNIITTPLMLLSAVFFPLSAIPEPYLTWLAYNPIAHAMELIREAWFPTYHSPAADLGYLSAWTIVLAALAMSSYRLTWKKVVAS